MEGRGRVSSAAVSLAAVSLAAVSLAAVSLAAAGLVAAAASAQQATPVVLPDIEVSTTPVPHAGGVSADKVPALLSSVTPKEFDERKSPSVTDAITQHVPGAIAISTDGSDLSPDLFYRGFDASRVSGRAQGLAVYQNGVRINEAFGDTVNLDLVPPIAVERADIITNNPIFGLNALGGAVSFTMKNGFTFQGGDVTILGGSFGRANVFGEFGRQAGDYSFFFAGDLYRDAGYRPFGAQNAQRFYADLGYRTPDSEVHAIGSFGRSVLGVQGTTPQVLVDQRYDAVFTSPQSTNNQAGLAQMTSRFDVSPHWSIASNLFIRQFDQFHLDGNDASVTDCSLIDGVNAGTLCQQPLAATGTQTSSQLRFVGPTGQPIPSMGPAASASFPYGTTARTSTHTTTLGAQLQATNKDIYFEHANYFVVGASIDSSRTSFTSMTSLGQINGNLQNVESGFPGAGTILNTAANVGVNSTFAHSNANFVGVFALDTVDVTERLALTVGARFNYAEIKLADASGQNPELNSDARYTRVNPVVGATYALSPWLTLYGGYSEANRAPTPLENACSNPNRPCVLETALISDPPLKQVVARTIEAGGRGGYAIPGDYGLLGYKAGFFRTSTTDDIFSEPSTISGQGFFTNVPETRRQGVEFGASYDNGPLHVYGNYAYVDATYQFTARLASPNNPFADAAGTILVTPGKRIPSIPRNIGKIGFDYALTPRFKVGMDTLLVGSQYYAADGGNLNPQLPFYVVANARASYQVTEHVQIFGLVNNLLDRRYATFGTFFNTATGAGNVNATLSANNPDNGGPGRAQAVTVGQPLSVYGGIKITF